RPDRPIGPDQNLLDRPENAAADELDSLTKAGFGRALIAHLGAELFLGGECAHESRFLDRPGERLLTEAMFAHTHRHDARRGVAMVGRAHRHGVDLIADLLEHVAIVEVLLRFGELFCLLVENMAVDIAECDDLAVIARVVGVAIALAADSDASESHL